MEKKKIVVATDFTSIGATAVNHAAVTAKYLSAKIHVVHIVSSDLEKESVMANMEEEKANILAVDHHIDVQLEVLVGNIYDTITEYAEEIHAHMIFMGTHGMSGMQFITGSKALKVVKSSKVPFVITQELKGKTDVGYKNILVPITLDVQTKQKLRYAVHISRYLDSTIHLIAAGETDEDFSRKVKLNMKYAINFLKEKNIDFTTTASKNIGSKFLEDILVLGEEKDADLITIMNLSDTGILSLFGSHFEQQLITNKSQIPVMLVNPFDGTIISGAFSS